MQVAFRLRVASHYAAISCSLCWRASLRRAWLRNRHTCSGSIPQRLVQARLTARRRRRSRGGRSASILRRLYKNHPRINTASIRFAAADAHFKPSSDAGPLGGALCRGRLPVRGLLFLRAGARSLARDLRRAERFLAARRRRSRISPGHSSSHPGHSAFRQRLRADTSHGLERFGDLLQPRRARGPDFFGARLRRLGSRRSTGNPTSGPGRAAAHHRPAQRTSGDGFVDGSHVFSSRNLAAIAAGGFSGAVGATGARLAFAIWIRRRRFARGLRRSDLVECLRRSRLDDCVHR